VNYYFTHDHLGSVREMTNTSGALVARYDYDPYGRRTLVSGTDLADFGFTGDYYHATSGLNLTLYRAYDANLGCWLRRDPLGESNTNLSLALVNLNVPTSTRLLPPTIDLSVDTNLYVYVQNSVINRIDRLGLKDCDCTKGAPPLRDDSPKCDEYGSETYLNSGLKCFCKCAGNSPWSQKVRGCLECEHNKGTNPYVAHYKCYVAGGSGAPYGVLAGCYAKCFHYPPLFIASP
jgi:RHS repeat-associated protein